VATTFIEDTKTKENYTMDENRTELDVAKNETMEIKPGVSDEVIIEIVHGIKEILIELIDKVFERTTAEVRSANQR
jgi:hypothetical protein